MYVYALGKHVPDSLATSGVLATISPCYIYSVNRQRLDHLDTLGAPLQGEVEYLNHECISYAALQLVYAGWALQVRIFSLSP